MKNRIVLLFTVILFIIGVFVSAPDDNKGSTTAYYMGAERQFPTVTMPK
ncbi:MAG: hypothetical protein SFZ02_12390 [bacterium]|nr:hypothetical protein [bacterium]